MKFTLHFKDGHEEVVEDAFPNFMIEGEDKPYMCGCDMDNGIITDDIPLESLKQIVVDLD